jgi:flagellin-specific chaperone FliS
MEQHEQLIARAAAYRGVAATRAETASPEGLVAILLDELIDRLLGMGGAMAVGCEPRRDEAKRGAEAILFALEASLNGDAGSLGGRMSRIYAEVRRLLDSGVAENAPDRCNQARALLDPVAEAWREIGQAA